MSTPRPSVLRALAAAGAGLAALWVLGGLLGAGTTSGAGGQPAGTTALLDRDAGRPVEVRVPDGFVATRAGDRLAMISRDGALRLVISSPDGVVDPREGAVELPTDPVQWLRTHPRVEVLQARSFRPGTGWGSGGWRGLDGRVTDFVLAQPTGAGQVLGRFASVPLFCDSTGGGCSRVSGRVRVRATFLTVRGFDRPLLVEAYWPRGTASDERMPELARAAYRSVVTDIALQSPQRGWAGAGG